MLVRFRGYGEGREHARAARESLDATMTLVRADLDVHAMVRDIDHGHCPVCRAEDNVRCCEFGRDA